jgi:hypothetical protein
MLGNSAGAALVALGIALVCAQTSSTVPGLCSRCRSGRYAETSTAQYSNIFCSKQCEQDFIRTALVSITLEDCVRIHQRLESLLTRCEEPGV